MPNHAWAQSSVDVQIPSGTSTTWTLNGQSYDGSTDTLSVSGGASNTATFSGVNATGNYQIANNSDSLEPAEGAPVASATSLSIVISGSLPTPTAGTTFSITSTGGPAVSVPTYSDLGYYANAGSNLDLTLLGVGAALEVGTGATSASAISVVTTGGAGAFVASITASGTATQPDFQEKYTTGGGDGGSAALTLGPAAGQASIVVALTGQVTETQTLPWLISTSGVTVSSVGGVGGAFEDKDGKYSEDLTGNGGNGGAVSVNIASGVNFALGTSAASLVTSATNPAAAIVATSIGLMGGVCCNVNGDAITMDPPPSGEQLAGPLTAGQNGSGGSVTVQYSGQIAGTSVNLYGIVASSVGASTQVSPLYTQIDQDFKAPASGVGGNVVVGLNGGSITLEGGNSVGVFASSTGGQVILPPGIVPAANDQTAGTVEIDVAQGVQVAVGQSAGTASGTLGAALIGISSTGWLFEPTSASTGGAVSAGSGGDVTVTNAGSLSATGGTAIGIAALSLGNGGILSLASETVSGYQYVSNNQSSASQSSTGGTVTVTNSQSGTISVTGNSAIGILAASNGSGGLLVNIPDAQFGASSADANNILIGTQASGFVAGAGASTYSAPGGDVVVTNNGSISVGGGNTAIGIVAQSVGGGGASFTEGVALFAGDAGGSGGNGGSITLTNSGVLSTQGDGSLGVLAQSVGGGGGHGANAVGLFVALGAQGGSGGTGGQVSMTLASGSAINTAGDFSSGLLMQSIGGGGGYGGYGKAYGVFASVGIGGSGGTGGDGGNVSVAAGTGVTATYQTTGDQSHGLLLQSIGGGGGTGGHAYSYSAGLVFAGAVAVGGSGGSTGNAGSVSLCETSLCTALPGTITTSGTDSVGVYLQSIGGGGGYGGGASGSAYALGVIGASDIPTVSMATSVGGNGSGGGDGGQIDVNSVMTIATSGTGSHAIFAQSVGGGGGAGADSTSGASAYDNSDFTFLGSVGVGGSGGGGGNGGDVSISTTQGSSLTTLGHNASGLYAQSIGGGGGYGAVGNAYQNDVSIGANQVGLALSVGGSGANGGAGGTVTVLNDATISTVGTQSPGLSAQSISGGGGLAGNAGAQGAGGNHNIAVVVGGNGGGGQAGGTVSVTNAGSITTGAQLDLASSQTNSWLITQPIAIGGDSHGILAQSIGGGGGVGGNADPSAALIGSVQTLLNEGAGDYVNASGLAEYIKTPSGAAPINYNASVAVGGHGGAGGNGGSVSVIHSGINLTTYGHRSYGILAQSIGGGGGIGGSSTSSSSYVSGSASFTPLTGFNLGLGINVGGAGGTSGAGGAVSIDLELSSAGVAPLIQTSGYASHAILAQSIGGGGGVGHDGSVFSAAGSIGVDTSIAVNPSVTVGSVTMGSSASSQGGAVLLGSSSAAAQGYVVTFGDDAAGVLLQTIGAGGGLASFGCTNSGSYNLQGNSNSSTSGSPSACLRNTSTTQVPNQSTGVLTPSDFQVASGSQLMAVVLQANTSVGSNGSNAGGGGIQVNSANNIQTQGDRAMAMVAQSVGGGGGMVIAPANAMASASLTSGGVNNAAGGTISIGLQTNSMTNASPGFYTSGDGAWGLFAQSVGGGGGFAGDPTFALSAVPSANNPNSTATNGTANGGDINIVIGAPQQTQNQPSIVTAGQNAHAVFVQSIGAGGGVSNAGTPTVGSTGTTNPQYDGAGGSINVDIYGGLIAATGVDSVALFAQSSGSMASSGPITINVFEGGRIIGASSLQSASASNGSPATAAVMISGGSTDQNNPNVVTIYAEGTITTNSSNQSAFAIVANDGYTNVVNNGTLSGSVDLGSTPGELTNTGTFNAGSTVVVSNNSLHNYGHMTIGSSLAISSTDITGRFVQHDSGTLDILVDTGHPARSDFIQVHGDIELGGELIPRTRNLQAGAITVMQGNNVSITATVRDTLIFGWDMAAQGQSITLTPVANFVPSGLGLTPNQQSLANYLQRNWNAQSGVNAQVFAYLHEYASSDESSYQNFLNQLSGQALSSQAIQMKTMFQSSLIDSFDCSNNKLAGGAHKGSTDCVWARVMGNVASQGQNSDNAGYRASSGGIRMGARRDIGHQWTVGAVLGYTNNYLTSTGFSSHGNFFDIGLSAQKQVNQWTFGGSLAFAQGWTSNNRTTSLEGNGVAPPLSQTYTSRPKMSMWGLRLRAAYEQPLGDYYIKPLVDVDAVYAYQSSFQESDGALALRAKSASQFNVGVTPMLELGWNTETSNKTAIRAFVGVGMSWMPNNTITTPMAFARDSDAMGTFDIRTKGPTTLGRMNLGVHVFNQKNWEVRAQYGFQAGSGYWDQSLSASVRYRF